jgi:hypothetical protein
MSGYEVARAQNIERNNAKLRGLGLISAREEAESNALAWRRRPTGPTYDDADVECSNGCEGDDAANNSPTSKTGRKRTRQVISARAPVRKSKRIQGLGIGTPDGTIAADNLKVQRRRDDQDEERRQRREECREARQSFALEHAALGTARAAKENPTATYEHCLMRVRTMSGPKLRNRIRAIERATGKHCVIKMAIMASCVQDEGMWELAQLAKESLERLKALQPPPP